MSEVQNILGLEVDLDKILSRSSLKDLQQFKLQREAVVKLENVTRQNREQEDEISQLHKQIETIQREESIKQERQSCIVLDLREQLKKLKEQINTQKMQGEQEIHKLQLDRENDFKAIMEKSTQLLEEKTSMIVNLPTTVQNKTNENQRLNELKRNTRQDVEREFKSQIDNLKNDYTRLLDQSKAQYEYFLQQKNEEIDKYIAQMKAYREKKKQKYNTFEK